MVAWMNPFLLSLWRGLRAGFRAFGDDIATLINTLLLLVVYIVGVGVTSIIAKLTGKRFLKRKIASVGAKTYWNDIKDEKPELDTHFRQF
jgi:hypothetical protein